MIYILLAIAALADVLSTRYALRRGAHEANPLMGKQPKLKMLLGFKLVAGLGIASMWYLTPPVQDWAYWLPIALWFAAALWNIRVAKRLK